jgi:GrpB-like predicted nucleotidyltransferase (UPF0157 family)
MAQSPRRSQLETARRLAKRGIPVAMELYRRWQALTPEQRERYLKMARDYANRAGDAYQRNRPGQSGARPRRPRRS